MANLSTKIAARNIVLLEFDDEFGDKVKIHPAQYSYVSKVIDDFWGVQEYLRRLLREQDDNSSGNT